LAALPLVLLWAAPKLNWAVLFTSTVIIATPFSHAFVTLLHSSLLQVCASLLMTAAAATMLWLGLRSGVAAGREPIAFSIAEPNLA
jgi:hypothetical protein